MASIPNCGSDHSHSCRSSSERPTHKLFLVPTSTTASLILPASLCKLIMPQVYGPRHGGKLTVQPTSAFHGSRLRRSEPDGGVAGQSSISKWAATQQHLARRQQDGVGAEVGHALYPAAAFEVQHRRFGIDPAEVTASEQVAAECDRESVEIERRVWISLLHAYRVRS